MFLHDLTHPKHKLISDIKGRMSRTTNTEGADTADLAASQRHGWVCAIVERASCLQPSLSKRFYISHVLDGFLGQHDRLLLGDADAVFYPYTDTSKMLRPSLIVWDIYTTIVG